MTSLLLLHACDTGQLRTWAGRVCSTLRGHPRIRCANRPIRMPLPLHESKGPGRIPALYVTPSQTSRSGSRNRSVQLTAAVLTPAQPCQAGEAGAEQKGGTRQRHEDADVAEALRQAGEAERGNRLGELDQVLVVAGV